MRRAARASAPPRLGILSWQGLLAGMGMLGGLFGVGGALAFLGWQYHVVLNLRRFARVGVTWSPTQAVVLWLVPIVNLAHGYRVASEVWRASDPTQVDGAAPWKGNPVPSLLGWWWASLVGWVILGWALAETWSEKPTREGHGTRGVIPGSDVGLRAGVWWREPRLRLTHPSDAETRDASDLSSAVLPIRK